MKCREKKQKKERERERKIDETKYTFLTKS